MTPTLRDALAAAEKEHGERVVEWTIINFALAMIPFAAILLQERDFVDLAKDLDLNGDDAASALRLLHAIKRSNDVHHAFTTHRMIAGLVPAGSLLRMYLSGEADADRTTG